jgi:O-antigen ligase
MSAQAAERRDRLGAWCGWVLAVGLAAVPLLAWLSPLSLAVYLGILGLLGLPALRIDDADRPLAVALLAGLVWAAISSVWSPYHPTRPGNNTALKLAFELPLYWSLVCAARRAAPGLKLAAAAVLAWSGAALGVLLLAEFALDAAIYERLHFAFYEPIRHDLAEVAIAHTSFVMALIWPICWAAGLKARITPWILVPMIAGTLAAATRFGADAPVLSVTLAALVGLVVLRWPAGGVRALAAGAVIYILLAPAVVAAALATGRYDQVAGDVPLSWSMRMGFWGHAVRWIQAHPLRGWGLEASRTFGPGIVLHPHDGALQVWLELGLVGALVAAVVWWLALNRLVRRAPDPGAAAVAASASVYLLFGALNFGVWQEWWLALAALVAAAAGLLITPEPARTST